MDSIILNGLSSCQKSVVLDCDSNLLVTACPGSGKTHTLTRKVAYTSNLFPESFKKIIAITYTNRAAQEIMDRLEKLCLNKEHIWVGTIHQFCLDFILRKFGLELERTSRKFKIIDEYTTSKYLQEIYQQHGVSYNPYNHPNLMVTTSGKYFEKNPTQKKLVADYHKKLKKNNEIDFDLILTLSLKILKKNSTITKIIANCIRTIYVDEYQDTNNFQYQILGQLAKSDKSIKFMFIGDPNQAIFTSLGGVVKNKQELEKITGLNFVEKKLDGCYRSTQKIVDLYSQFQTDKYTITSLAKHNQEIGVIKYDKSTHKNNLSSRISDIIQELINDGIEETEICIVAANQFILAPIARDLKAKLVNLKFRSQDIYPIKPDDLNLFYKISSLVFTPSGERLKLRKLLARDIIKILRNDFHAVIKETITPIDILDNLNSTKLNETDGLKFLNHKIISLFDFLNLDKEHYSDLFQYYDDFFNKTADRINNKKLNLTTDIDNFTNVYKVKSGINISTIHKTKGEEYEVIIAFGFLQDIVPHFKAKNPIQEANKLLYVTLSRAKKRIYLFSEKGRQTYSYPEKKPTNILNNIIFK